MKKKVIVISIVSITLIIGISMLLKKATKNTYAVSVGDTLVDYVKSESLGNSYDADSGDGVYLTNNNEYRYIGADPNNFVWFNNDMYRIIGVFDENSHGVKDSNDNGIELVKVIRSRMLGSYSWGIHNKDANSGVYKNYTNDWSGTANTTKTNLNILLNHFYLEDTTNNYSACHFWTYFSPDGMYRTYNCTDILGYGIKEDSGLQDYIEEVTWYLKGYSGTGFSKQNFYLCERGQSEDTNNCGNAGASVEYDGSTQAKIGLMYASDYLYASGYVALNDSDTLASSTNYGIKNWLYNIYEWTITPQFASTTFSFATSYNSKLEVRPIQNMNQIRPTFYLKSSVYVTGGNGSFDNPYTIACDDCSS